MKVVPDKGWFVRIFCAVSIIVLMACSSLVSVAAAIGGANVIEETPVSEVAATEAPSPKKVVLDVNGTQRTVLFSGETVEELLRVTDTIVTNRQIVVPERSAKVTPYMVVTVRNAKPVTVTADGKTREVMLAYGTVQDALRLAGYALGTYDILSVSRDAQVETVDELTIERAAR